jgi:hypothetical protein
MTRERKKSCPGPTSFPETGCWASPWGGRLASGSFGTVYRASRDGRAFAIKVVPWSSRAEREVDALRRAQFPNVVASTGMDGPADDLWALGVTLYFLLTRELPFGDRGSAGMNRAILHEMPPAPHELNPRVPPALGRLCMRMLEKTPEVCMEISDADGIGQMLKPGNISLSSIAVVAVTRFH